MEFGNLLTGLLVVVFIVTCAALILVVLIQRPQGGGLSGAFGGGSGSGQTAFGAKVGDVLTYATIAIFILFLLTAIGLTYAIRPSDQPAQAPGAVGGQTPAEQVPTEAPPTDPTVQNPDPDDETFDAAPPPTGDEILLPDDETEQPPADEPPADEPPADDPPADEPG